MPRLVAGNQYAYVKSRGIADATLLVQELVHSMNQRKESNAVFAWKIDISKAYDSLEWNFIQEVMKRRNFSEKMWIY